MHRPSLFATALQRAWWHGGALSIVLLPLAWLYGGIVALRRRRFLGGQLARTRLDVPVVVVGNRIVGGAGKTPVTIALARALTQAGWHPGVVSRGHGRQGDAVTAVRADSSAAEVGDEPLLIARRAAVPVWVGRDRGAAARALRAAHPEVDLLLCDDGLQHLALARDVEVIVFDERGAGNGRLLPAGPLREPIDAPAAARAQLVLYNASAASTPLRGFGSQRRLTGAVALEAWWRGEAATCEAMLALRGRRVVATAGLAQPQRFFDALRSTGLDIETLALPDHDAYLQLPWPADVHDVVVTEKDAVKLRPERVAAQKPGLRVWVAPLELRPDEAFLAALQRALPPAPRTPST